MFSSIDTSLTLSHNCILTMSVSRILPHYFKQSYSLSLSHFLSLSLQHLFPFSIYLPLSLSLSPLSQLYKAIKGLLQVSHRLKTSLTHSWAIFSACSSMSNRGNQKKKNLSYRKKISHHKQVQCSKSIISRTEKPKRFEQKRDKVCFLTECCCCDKNWNKTDQSRWNQRQQLDEDDAGETEKKPSWVRSTAVDVVIVVVDVVDGWFFRPWKSRSLPLWRRQRRNSGVVPWSRISATNQSP